MHCFQIRSFCSIVELFNCHWTNIFVLGTTCNSIATSRACWIHGIFEGEQIESTLSSMPYWNLCSQVRKCRLLNIISNRWQTHVGGEAGLHNTKLDLGGNCIDALGWSLGVSTIWIQSWYILETKFAGKRTMLEIYTMGNVHQFPHSVSKLTLPSPFPPSEVSCLSCFFQAFELVIE